MRVDVNLFHKRYSDSNEELDIDFVNIFSSEILQVFDNRLIWSTINLIRSSPGAGKTTLLKLFTPNILRYISRNRSVNDNLKDLYKELAELGVYSEDKLMIYGALTPFTREYFTIELLRDISESLKNRIFFALLNSRIVLSFLNSICTIHELDFFEDLEEITYEFSIHPSGTSNKFPTRGTGNDLLNWAQGIEEAISEALDSILIVSEDNLIGHSDLFVFSLLDLDKVKVDGQAITGYFLLMFDDIHNLSSNQRKCLLDDILKKRPKTKLWIAERLQSLSTEEVFDDNRTISVGQTYGREINVIEIEQVFESAKKFEKFCKSVADKRVQVASNDEIGHFGVCIAEIPNTGEVKKLSSIYEGLFERVKEGFLEDLRKSGGDPNFEKEILSKLFVESDAVLEKLTKLRALEILMVRNRNRQLNMYDNEGLANMEVSSIKPDIQGAARLFLYNEFKDCPYYFGFSNISRVGSRNIEQFIEVAGNLFEDIISQKVFSRVKAISNYEVSIFRQNEIIKRFSERKWNDFRDKIPDFNSVEIFINSMVKFCKSHTYRANAPIAPGVNGIAITMGFEFSDRDRLRNAIDDRDSNPLKRLARIIATCISYNILEERLDKERKGKSWTHLYLNKAICVKNDLPMNYGGFKELNLDTLVKWMNKNYKPFESLWH